MAFVAKNSTMLHRYQIHKKTVGLPPPKPRVAEESYSDKGDNKKRTRRVKKGKNKNEIPALSAPSFHDGADAPGPSSSRLVVTNKVLGACFSLTCCFRC
jgi:hypothetical protein